MKNKISRSVALLFIAVISTTAVIAQPGYHNKDDNGQRDDAKYNKSDRWDDNDRWDDDRDDRDGRYSKGYNKNRDYRNDNRDYRQYKVRHKPSVPYYVQSRRPSPHHVWIDGDWVINRGQYTYRPGYWMVQNHSQSFVPGHWEKVHRGWYWAPGYWTRGNGRW